ncbi:hypothetical protein [Methanocella conradii]|uniref:hypothetical protein n=1 Tax=Methanocella conradii TaxID=1175444 RepID=UPI0024B39E39|nr:hypothetical protein [Methanocella conradii]MDI6896748.1 hypothetical protein [Methanocella conradii]
MDDDSGQVILMMAIIIVIGMVVLLVYLNQSLLAGRSSSMSIMNFPKNDIRELKEETIAEAYTLGRMVNDNLSYNVYSVDERGIKREQDYNENFNRYSDSISRLYAEKGSLIKLTSTPRVENGNIVNATVTISYKNGETTYFENTTIQVLN